MFLFVGELKVHDFDKLIHKVLFHQQIKKFT